MIEFQRLGHWNEHRVTLLEFIFARSYRGRRHQIDTGFAAFLSILLTLLMKLQKRLVAPRLGLDFLKVHLVFEIVGRITKHRVSLTGARLSVHEYRSIHAI